MADTIFGKIARGEMDADIVNGKIRVRNVSCVVSRLRRYSRTALIHGLLSGIVFGPLFCNQVN